MLRSDGLGIADDKPETELEPTHIETRPGSGKPFDTELYLNRPDTDEPRPAVLYVHGHQLGERSGARAFVEAGILSDMTERHGFVSAALSMPGYGATAGPPDYCGPKTQAAVDAAIEHLRGQPYIDPDTIVLYGVSRGAITSAMVATRSTRLKALILVAGIYDMAAAYPTGAAGLDRNILHETGATPEAFAARSALLQAHRISAATLILHGANDTRAGSDRQARRLAATLRANGVFVRERLFSDIGHRIPLALQNDEIQPFLSEVLTR